MKLVTFRNGNRRTLGVHMNHSIVDIVEAVKVYAPDAPIAADIMELIRGGKEALSELEAYMNKLPVEAGATYVKAEAAIDWEPCVTEPQKLICVGLNYRKHAEETRSPIPDYPILFNKFNNALTGNNKAVTIPTVTTMLDYEAELAIVIGRRAKSVSKEEALEYVFGYTIANDLSARDLQRRTQQWMLGKICDGFAPLGPYLVTADEIDNPNALSIQTVVNGEMRQNSNTADMIFYCDEIVSYISQHMTLEPGDVILTGTPEGVVLGLPKEQRVFLQPGDEVTVRIEALGELHNVFIAEEK